MSRCIRGHYAHASVAVKMDRVTARVNDDFNKLTAFYNESVRIYAIGYRFSALAPIVIAVNNEGTFCMRKVTLLNPALHTLRMIVTERENDLYTYFDHLVQKSLD